MDGGCDIIYILKSCASELSDERAYFRHDTENTTEAYSLAHHTRERSDKIQPS